MVFSSFEVVRAVAFLGFGHAFYAKVSGATTPLLVNERFVNNCFVFHPNTVSKTLW